MSILDRFGPWILRALWVLLALVAAPVVDGALRGRSGGVAVVLIVGAWLGWAVGFGALLVPRSSALTVARVVVPGGLAMVLGSLAAGGGIDGVSVAATAVAAAALVVVLAPPIGEWFVDGSSYGPEHRLPLRPPATFTLLVVPVTWALMALGAVTGPLLLAAGRLATGIPALLVGLAIVAVGGRSLHQLSRRWVVLVPTGMVIHDALTMPEPQLLPRTSIRRLGPAAANTSARDLTSGAPGLAIEAELKEPIEILARGRGRAAATEEIEALIFTPSRPARLLEKAKERRIPVG